MGAPEQGKHGGWIDRQNLTYKVVRMPGGTLVGKDLTDTEFTDRTITTMSKYSYMIYAVTPDGESDPASSIEIALGSQIALFPYNCCSRIYPCSTHGACSTPTAVSRGNGNIAG